MIYSKYIREVGECMDKIISLIISLVTCYIVFKIFETKGFKEALFFKLLVQIVINVIDGTLIASYELGILYLLVSLAIILIVNLITTGIEYFIYKKTSSFLSYIIWGALAEYLVALVFSFILTFIGIIF